MAKTIDEQKAKAVYAFLELYLTPRLKKLVDETNVYLVEKHGIQVGANLEWLIHELTEEEKKNVKKD